jgi:hypothetical protein
VQTGPPRFSAYVASKAALDAWAEIVATEVLGEGVTFTTVHMPLVRTPMIAPTRIYDAFPTDSPEEAADKVLHALIDRPKHVGTLLGTFGAVSAALTPRLKDAVMHIAFRVFPESAAAREGSEPSDHDDARTLDTGPLSARPGHGPTSPWSALVKTPFGTPSELATGLRLLTGAGVVAPVPPHRLAMFPAALSTATASRPPRRTSSRAGAPGPRRDHRRPWHGDVPRDPRAHRPAGARARRPPCRPRLARRGALPQPPRSDRDDARGQQARRRRRPAQHRALTGPDEGVAEEQEITTVVADADLADRLEELPA